MKLRRIAVLLRKDLFQGPKNFLFVWAFLGPVAISLVVSLVFGTLFTHEPTLGIVDEGSSQLVALIEELPSINNREYTESSELREAVASGVVDVGLVIPSDFDSLVSQGEEVSVPVYVWGESLAQDRTVLAVAIANQIRELLGEEAPVEIEAVTLGNEMNIPWSDRLLPFIVLLAVVFGGFVLPATSLLDEKEKRTIDALTITPASVGEVFWAKGALGLIISMVIGIVILILNQAIGAQPALLILLLFLGSIMAVAMGLLLGSVFKDVMSFFATVKALGIILYVPVILYMFPSLPQWIGKIFPTYYIVEPIVEVSQRGGGWPEIALNTSILILIDLLLIALIAVTLRGKRQYAV